MNKIQQFFQKNIGLKLISLVAAIILWLVVVNISNPEVKTSVSSPITVKHEEELTKNDKSYSLDTNNVRVTFSVRQSRRLDITSNDFEIYVDMRDYSMTGGLPVYYSAGDRIKDAVSDIKVEPVMVHATLEDMREKTFDMTITTQGEPMDGYAVGPVTFSPNRVKLYGPYSEIGRINRIGCTVDVSNASTNIWGPAEFEYYDANDNRFTPDSRIKVMNAVNYHIPILKKKTVSVTVQTTGSPSPGYGLDSVTCEPSFLEIYGEDSVLENVNAIILPDTLLNISNATSDVTASIDIRSYLPDGIYSDAVGNIALVARITRAGATPTPQPPIVVPGPAVSPTIVNPENTETSAHVTETESSSASGEEEEESVENPEDDEENVNPDDEEETIAEDEDDGDEAGAENHDAGSGADHGSTSEENDEANAGGGNENANSGSGSHETGTHETGTHESGAHETGSGSGSGSSASGEHQSNGQHTETGSHNDNTVVSESKAP